MRALHMRVCISYSMAVMIDMEKHTRRLTDNLRVGAYRLIYACAPITVGHVRARQTMVPGCCESMGAKPHPSPFFFSFARHRASRDQICLEGKVLAWEQVK